MSTLASSRRVDWDTVASTALTNAARFWFLVTVSGQWLFVYFIAAFYYVPTLQGNFEAWSRNKALPHGYVPGDTIGNLLFAAHVLLAAVMTLGGAFQLIPYIRARIPALHRWNGRVFIVTALTLSASGLYMVWIGGRNNSIFMSLGITLNAALIIACCVMAWRNAVARDFTAHRRWALRAFLAASGVWFLRLGYTAWIILNQGPVGIAKDGTGPFDIFVSFANSLVPLIMLELYLRAQRSTNPVHKLATATALIVSTLIMGVGIFGAYMFFWKPLL